MKKVVGYSLQQAEEGLKINYVFSEIDEEGNIVSRNNRGTLIVLEQEKAVHKAHQTIAEFLKGRLT